MALGDIERAESVVPGLAHEHLFFRFLSGSKVCTQNVRAFNISLLADLPLFVDPFLLFHSKKPKYRALHDRMIDYLRFLKQKSELGNLDSDLLDAWYRFAEIKQNWLGFAGKGNQGRGLGRGFATALNDNLGKIFGCLARKPLRREAILKSSA